MEDARASRSRLVPLALAATVSLPALVPWLRGRVFVFRDLVDFFLPMKVFLHRRLMEGDLPLWDPWTGCGGPFLAHPQAQVLYPPNLLACLLPMPRAFGLYAGLHLVVAAVGTWLWLRRLELRPSAAAAGALAYGLGGPLIATIEVSNNLATMAWWPWIGWAATAMATGAPPWAFAALVGSLAMAFLGGEPHLAVAGGGVAMACCWLPETTGKGGTRPWGRTLMAGVLAAGLCLPLALPFGELLLRSDRRDALPVEEAARWGAGTSDALRYLGPARDAYRLGSARPLGQSYLRLLYGGSVTLGMAVLALAGSRRRRATLLACAGLTVCWLLALDPVFRLVQPVLFGFRFPAKLLVPASLFLALLAALGWEKLLEARRADRGWEGAVLLLPPAASAAAWLAGGETRFLHGLVAGAVATAVLWLVPSRRLAAAAGVAVLAVDLLAAHLGVLPTASAEDLYRPPAVARWAREARTRVYPRPQSLDSLAAAWPSEDPDPWPRYARNRVEMLAGNIPEAVQVPSARGGAVVRPAATAAWLDLADRGPAGLPALRAMGAGLFLSHEPVPLPGFLRVGRSEGSGEDVWIYRIPPPPSLPLAWLAQRWAVGEVDEGALESVARRITEDDTVLLDRAPRFSRVERTSATDISWVAAQRRDPDQPSWEVRTAAASVLVVLQGWAPGWKATLDGRPTPLLRANGAFRAVAVPPGRHTVEMSYRPSSLRLGWAGALLSFLGLCALLLLGRRRLDTRRGDLNPARKAGDHADGPGVRPGPGPPRGR